MGVSAWADLLANRMSGERQEVSPTSRVITGIGSSLNPIDGDRITVQIGLREGKVAYAGANDIIVAQVTHTVGSKPKQVEFKTGAAAKAAGEEFAGCEAARRAALQIYAVFGGRSADDALSVGVDALFRAMGGASTDRRACVVTVLDAVRRALVDARARILAEEIIESRRVPTGG